MSDIRTREGVGEVTQVKVTYTKEFLKTVKLTPIMQQLYKLREEELALAISEPSLQLQHTWMAKCHEKALEIYLVDDLEPEATVVDFEV